MAQGITGVDGKVTFDLEPGTYLIQVVDPRFAPEPDVTFVHGVQAEEAPAITLDPKSYALTVPVVDRAGNPVAGAPVTVTLQ